MKRDNSWFSTSHSPPLSRIFSIPSARPLSASIGYIKWDMNRDIHQAGNGEGRHAPHRQTRALYHF